jgi:hypothetical protein
MVSNKGIWSIKMKTYKQCCCLLADVMLLRDKVTAKIREFKLQVNFTDKPSTAVITHFVIYCSEFRVQYTLQCTITPTLCWHNRKVKYH